MRHASRPEPRHSRGGPVRHREGDQPRLVLAPDSPERIDIVLVNGDPNPKRPDLRPYGAGEASLKPMLAAIANAIYDAAGVRIRRVPFRPDRVLAALKAARV